MIGLAENVMYALACQERNKRIRDLEIEMLKSLPEDAREKYYKEQKEERRHQELCKAIRVSKTTIYNSIF